MRFSVFIFAAVGLTSIPVSAAEQGAAAIDLTPTHPAAMPELPPASVREGTHFINRTGRLNRGSGIRPSIFYFDPDGSSPATPPMIVEQNLNLYSMEAIQAGRNQPIGFRVSGTVSEYKGHNYILLDQAETTLAKPGVAPAAVATRSTTNRAAVVQPTDKTPDGKGQPTTGPTTDATPNDTMTRLLAPPLTFGEPLPPPLLSGVPTIDRTTGIAAVAPAAVPLPVVREGTHLVNRTGRLAHSPDGKDCVFTFDSDGNAMKDPPMFVLPNLKLQTMESSNANLSKDAHFRVSGTITEYKGRNYVELDKAVMMADVEAQF